MRLSILLHPHPNLKIIAKPVAQIDASIKELVANMFETMYDANGIGLAATQIDVHQRIIVIDVSEERNQPLVLINPEVVWASDEMVSGEEGCLSVPTIYDGVTRHERITVKALDEHGQFQEIAAEGLLAICIQHEMDHLMGKVFVEYLSPLKQSRIKTKLIKAQKDGSLADTEKRPSRARVNA